MYNYSELEYRRKWLHQLQAEFSQICTWYGISLDAPAFRISDSTAILGSWNAETRTISISATLIGEYSWDAVISILKHEMAHQYVHECMGRTMEHPHGVSFLLACEKIGVVYPFNKATGDTPKVFTAEEQPGADTEYDRKVRKVRKMLSLAGSTNRHEAEAAMSKANSFIRKYNLERLDSAEPARYSYAIIKTGKQRLQVIERRIASLLMDYFYVDVVYSELFDQEKLATFKTIELLGTAENVAFASHAFDFLSQRAEHLWLNYKKSAGVAGRLRKSYILGLLQGFREKLETEERRHNRTAKVPAGLNRHKTISALVVAKDPHLAEFTANRFPRMRKVQYRISPIHCSDTYSAGKTEGRKITIHKTVRQDAGNRGRLLSN